MNEVTGDVVEVWATPEMPDLDPLTALINFMQMREKKFGKAEEHPLFLHENGKLLTKQQFNSDLKNLLSIYPQLCAPDIRWTGHCFRSGISTLLATLGFEDHQIQNWGRWHSSAFLRYIHDKRHRKEVRKGLTSTFVKIKNSSKML